MCTEVNEIKIRTPTRFDHVGQLESSKSAMYVLAPQLSALMTCNQHTHQTQFGRSIYHVSCSGSCCNLCHRWAYSVVRQWRTLRPHPRESCVGNVTRECSPLPGSASCSCEHHHYRQIDVKYRWEAFFNCTSLVKGIYCTVVLKSNANFVSKRLILKPVFTSAKFVSISR